MTSIAVVVLGFADIDALEARHLCADAGPAVVGGQGGPASGGRRDQEENPGVEEAAAGTGG